MCKEGCCTHCVISQFFYAGPGPLTLFAPDNANFKKLPKGALDALLKDKYKLIGASFMTSFTLNYKF